MENGAQCPSSQTTACSNVVDACSLTRSAAAERQILLWNALSVASKVAGLAILWWSAAVIVTLKIKDVLSERGGIFPHTFLFTGLLNISVVAWSILLTGILHVAKRLVAGPHSSSDRRSLQRHEAGFLLFVGIMQGLELGLANKSLSLVSVTVNRMIMACCVVFQLLTAICWRLEGITMLKWVAAGLLVLGGVTENLACSQRSSSFMAALCGPHDEMPSKSDNESTFLGWVFVVASVLISANRWALTQHIFQRFPTNSAVRKMTKMEMLPYISPGTTIVCLVLAGIFEAEAFAQLQFAATQLAVPLLIVSASITILVVCELLIVDLTAATVMVILSVVHNIPIMLGGVLINHDRVYRNQLFGFALCTVGATVYFAARMHDAPRPTTGFKSGMANLLLDARRYAGYLDKKG